MPKITKGGVSNKIIDPAYLAPPGTPVDVALALGLPDQGEDAQEDPPSRSKNSPGSSERQRPNTPATKSDEPIRSSALSTAGPSITGQAGNSTASSAGMSSSRKK